MFQNLRRLFCLSLIMILFMGFITGCSQEPTEVKTEPEAEVEAEVQAEQPAGPHITEMQRNSINMLNYLAGLTQEINASKNSRLFLEEAYSVLLNNTHPNAVDEKTQDHLIFLLDTLNNYRMIAKKRDRLQFLYEQNRAHAIHNAIPQPLILLNPVNEIDWQSVALSAAFMAVEYYADWKESSGRAEMQFIQDGWELDYAEQEVMHSINIETFTYLTNTVRELGLKGDDALLALNDDAIKTFVEWKNNNNVSQRIHFLETNQKKYKAYGDYWLVLAESYYHHGDFEKCLNAVASYEALDIRIFRDDKGYSRILPLAITAAGEVLSGEDYIQMAEHYADAILDNTDDNYDWALRYFVAQTFIDLYAKTQENSYLKKAYEIALDNVNRLSPEQKNQNKLYLAEIKKHTIPNDATEAEKKEIENYNKQIMEDRKLALPPVYEPLLINCELLFSLADKVSITDSEKKRIDEMLHENRNDIFLVPTLNAKYCFDNSLVVYDTKEIDIGFNGKELSIPAKYVTNNTVIKVTVMPPDSNDSISFEDWVLNSVERKEQNDLESFKATFKSDSAEKHPYTLDSYVKIEIDAHESASEDILIFKYKTVNPKTNIWENIAFWNPNIAFKREE